MSLWNYISEFFLFRWLFDKFRKSTTEHDAHAEGLRTSVDGDGESLYDNHDEDIVQNDRAATPVGDESIDDSDNSEDLDDLDIFMRNNNSNNHSNLHYGDYDGDYHPHNDWNSGSYSQSYDDFHDEQDDYDMIDDDF